METYDQRANLLVWTKAEVYQRRRLRYQPTVSAHTPDKQTNQNIQITYATDSDKKVSFEFSIFEARWSGRMPLGNDLEMRRHGRRAAPHSRHRGRPRDGRAARWTNRRMAEEQQKMRDRADFFANP
jgi:hypothetical protein